MKWLRREDKFYSHPYILIREVRGFSCWIQTETRYANLGRELSLDKAKNLCLKHSLDAVDVK